MYGFHDDVSRVCPLLSVMSALVAVEEADRRKAKISVMSALVGAEEADRRKADEDECRHC